MPKRIALILFAVILVFAVGCGRAGDEDPRTETIEAAVPPEGEGGGDAVITQTTEIGEDRSPHEGGVLTNPPQETGTGKAAPPPTATTTNSQRRP